VVGKPPQIRGEDLPVKISDRNHLPTSGSLAAMEKAHVQSVLEQNNWNISRSAEILDIDRVTLYNKINKYGLRKP
jgi:transcriptional regulator of acetoin/glycerol metabolism